jgi:hypothetical protein
MANGGKQNSEIRSQKSEVRNQKSEGRRKTEGAQQAGGRGWWMGAIENPIQNPNLKSKI